MKKLLTATALVAFIAAPAFAQSQTTTDAAATNSQIVPGATSSDDAAQTGKSYTSAPNTDVDNGTTSALPKIPGASTTEEANSNTLSSGSTDPQMMNTPSQGDVPGQNPK
ncbi:hypothetical protein NPA31_002450 [Aurantimonas sp. MSK8Z-1]|uniref:hypothetical protein n=1 Tax=Mangrovibrevibacter kandeliae TaxID=2968473 RepID=UPI00211902C8|nr:hypothetical protein [Aurantimonas sp. MSK8Z-1]MCW4113824.1 hypothetical protein [Aurantimonas sp. MSK8Z-1]